MQWCSCTFFVFAIALNYGAGENTYTAFLPKYIRPGFEVAYRLSVFNTINSVQVTSTFLSSDSTFRLQKVYTIQSGASKRIVLGTVPLLYSGSTDFSLELVGVDTVTSTEVFRNSTDGFVFASKAFSIFIQTDKAIYKPGHTIKFRAICLNSDLRPLNETVTYQVQDPNENIVLLEQNVSLTQGVVGNEFPLNKDSVVGDWKISYIVQGYKETLPVTVELYKLPKFEVKLEIPSYVHPKMEGLTVKLTATYTYGKPVEGSAQLFVSQSQSHYFGPLFDITSPEGMERTIAHTNKKFDGTWEIFIPLDQIRRKLDWRGTYKADFEVLGIVTEQYTETSFNTTEKFSAQPTNIKVSTLFKLETIKPGLTYTAYIEVNEHDGKKLMEEDRQSNSLIVDVTYEYPRGHQFPEDATTPSRWSYRTRQETLLYPIPENGIVAVSIEAKTDEFTSIKLVPYTNATENFGRYDNQFEAKRAQSPSNSFLQIVSAESSVSPGTTASFQIKTTEPISSFDVMILGRGEILRNVTSITPDGSSSTNHDFFFPVTHSMVPAVFVLASYRRPQGEIVADYMQITVTLSLEDQVTITSSAAEVDAGNDVSIRIQTNGAGAFVGARAIDQSVLLLKSGNDISTDRVVKDLDRYSTSDGDSDEYEDFAWWWWYYPRPSGAKDATEVFEKAGMICLTDALLYSGTSLDDYFPIFYDEGILFDADLGYAGEAYLDSPSPTTASKSRLLFPETWLWSKNISGADGSVVFNTTAPDTITSWVISAFSVSEQYGLGIADTTKVTVFRKFFVSLNLPLKITRGEIIIVQAIVFNYFKVDVQVRLTLRNSSEFEFIYIGDDIEASGMQRIFNIRPDGAHSVKFPIRINSLGEVPVTVSAVTDIAGDTVTRRVFVRPEGFQQCYSTSALINRDYASGAPSAEQLKITFPEGIIEGSEKANLYVYGDILGSTMNNLGRLLQTPGGCGEQNMLRFAPDVFVTIYLTQANMLDTSTKDKAYGHIRDGYSIELKYKHDDGSYSAFGGKDNSGSTWLTAFVIKCFIFARQVRSEFVESRIVDQGIEFLLDTQTPDGIFEENGHVSHTDMQGGVNSDITMTAYVLITLKETNYSIKNPKANTRASAALSYLESNLDEIVDDPYALSLVTYALHVSSSAKSDYAFNKLERLATVTGGMKYWHRERPEASSYSQRWNPPYYRPPSNDIEMTSYAMLTYVRRNNVIGAAPIIKWLTSKQNQFGGYSSTQDTVMAVQALAEVAALLINRPQDLTISVSHSAVEGFSTSYSIDQTNSIVFNTLEVEPVNGFVQIEAGGRGVGVAQLSVCYNIPEDPYTEEPFDCDSSVDSENVDRASVKFCCRLKPGDTELTGMFLFEVGLPNGFTVDLQSEILRNRRAQLVELGDSSLNVYYNELGHTRICADVKLERSSEVAAVKPSTMVASDYYKPSKKVARLYNPEVLADAGPCEVCGVACVGCPGPRLTEWGKWTPCGELCTAENTTRVRKCIDPNQNKVLDISECGLIETPLQTKACKRERFPCPDAYSGLWFDLPRAYSSRYGSYYQRLCYGTSNSTKKGIPGNTLDGERESLTCSLYPKLTPRLNGTSGFTVSFLVKTDAFPNGKSVTYFSYGKEGKTPTFALQKIFWRDEIRFSLKHRTNRYRVKNIPTAGIVGNWKHMVVTWNERDGARVYVGGQLMGSSRTLSARNYRSKYSPSFHLGKSTVRQSLGKGYLRGTISGFMLWNKALSQDEVQELSSFFQPLLDTEEEPLLTVRHLRFFSPSHRRYCFNKPSRLSSIYDDSENLRWGSQCERRISSPII